MPYPAHAYSGVALLPGTLDAYHGGHYTGDVPARSVWEGNSASTNNPLRSDSTRAMAPFQRWGSRCASDARIRVRSYYGSPDEWFDYIGPRPCFQISSKNELKVWDGGEDAALLDAFASYGENRVQYSTALQQAGQTSRMIGQLGRGIAEGLGDQFSKHGQAQWGRQQMRNWKKLPGWYLEYLYGWKPLAEDIENVTRQLSESIDYGDSLHVILKGRWKGRAEKYFYGSAGGLTIGWLTEYHFIVEQRNKAQFRYDIPRSGVENVQPLGFFGNLWEGSPYSFVLDWAAPMGQWLTALDANALAPYFTEGCVSEYLKTLSIRVSEIEVGGWHSSSLGGGLFNGIKPYSFTRVLRGPNTLSVGIPIRNPLGINHAAQGLALLTQVLKSWY